MVKVYGRRPAQETDYATKAFVLGRSRLIQRPSMSCISLSWVGWCAADTWINMDHSLNMFVLLFSTTHIFLLCSSQHRSPNTVLLVDLFVRCAMLSWLIIISVYCTVILHCLCTQLSQNQPL